MDEAVKSYEKCLDMLISLAIQLENCIFRNDIALPHSVYVVIVKATVLCINERLAEISSIYFLNLFDRNYKKALDYCRKLLLAHGQAWLSGLQQVGVA